MPVRNVSLLSDVADRALPGAEQANHGRGTHDPHAWQDPKLAAVYADNVAVALIAIDPVIATGYRDNLAAYREKLATLDDEIGAMMAARSDRYGRPNATSS